MLNKKLLTAAIGATLLAGTTATAVQAFDLSANVALVSDYRFRGISQTDTNAAIQGGFDASFEPGFYLGTWASSVDFGDGTGNGSYGTMEIDYYTGWAGPIGDTDFAIDVGYAYYQYPGDTVDPVGDYQEFHITPSWKGLSVNVVYSDDFYAETGEMWYYSADYSLSFLEDFSFGIHAGYNDFDEQKFLGDNADSYTDYSATLGYSFKGVDFSVAWVGTDLDESECWDSNICDDTAVFSISKSL